MKLKEATTSKFMITDLCPGTPVDGPRAKKALAVYDEEFPLVVNVRKFGANPEICPKCGAKRFKLTVESQTDVERIFGFETRETRAVCESMGAIIR